MLGLEVQPRADVEGRLEERALLLDVVVEGEVLGDEGQPGLHDLALPVVAEGELELGEAVEELARDLVEEDGALAVVLGGDPEGQPLREREEDPRLLLLRRRRRRRRGYCCYFTILFNSLVFLLRVLCSSISIISFIKILE